MLINHRKKGGEVASNSRLAKIWGEMNLVGYRSPNLQQKRRSAKEIRHRKKGE